MESMKKQSNACIDVWNEATNAPQIQQPAANDVILSVSNSWQSFEQNKM